MMPTMVVSSSVSQSGSHSGSNENLNAQAQRPDDDPRKRAALAGLLLTLAAAGLCALLWLIPRGHGEGGAPPGGNAPPPPPAKPDNSSGGAGGTSTPRPTTRVSEGAIPHFHTVHLLVPAYFYPSGEGLKNWEHLMEAARQVDVVAIVNPSSGPGEDRKPDYEGVIKKAREHKVRVIGYVSTDYGNRPLDQVTRDIDRWTEFYPDIVGFFFDQQANGPGKVSYYLQARDHARQKLKGAFLVNNPGVVCDDRYFTENVADVTCIFADVANFTQFSPPETYKQFDASRFAALPYHITDPGVMHEAIRHAVLQNIGYVYVSDAPQGGNPWGQLPGYLDEEVRIIRTIK
jgi:hypothetical protein